MMPALGVAIGVPLTAFYVLVVVIFLDMDSNAGQYALFVPLSYILGAMPFGSLLVQATKGIDVTKYGSGKTGMSNVLRTAGGKLATIVLAIDASKGALSVALAWAVAGSVEARVVGGLAAVAGHNWSIFLGFKGGRGVVTALAGLLVLQPISGAIAVATFLPVTLTTRYFSAGSLTAIGTGFLASLVIALIDQGSYSYLLYTGPSAITIFWLHRDNIERLWHGTERRIGQPAQELAEASPGGDQRS